MKPNAGIDNSDRDDKHEIYVVTGITRKVIDFLQEFTKPLSSVSDVCVLLLGESEVRTERGVWIAVSTYWISSSHSIPFNSGVGFQLFYHTG